MTTAQTLIAKAKVEQATFLDLGNLGLTEIPDELMELTQLEQLNLGNRYYEGGKMIASANTGPKNIIKFIPYKFRRLVNLKELSLHGCFCVDVFYLKEFPQLTSLDLSYSYHIRDFSFFKYLRNLKHLFLNKTALRDLYWLRRLKYLESLDISFARVKSLAGLKKFPLLQRFEMAGGWSQEVEHLAGIENLQILHLSTTAFPEGLAFLKSLKQLTSLDLGDCHLHQHYDYLADLQQLRHLNLWRNKITDTSFLQSLTQLKHLNLGENNIQDIPSISQLSQLEWLNLSYNQLESIETIRNLSQLAWLDIGNNPKLNDYRHLATLRQLQSLVVRNNKLTELDWASTLPPLENLDVRWNEITQVPESLQKWATPVVFGLQRGINLYGNPIHNRE